MQRAHNLIAVLGSCLFLALSLIAGRADAAGETLLRVALLPKVSLGSAAQPQAALETALGQALSSHGMRIVDLTRASESQRLMWSDRVRAGEIPEGANLLLADALYAAQLDCFQTATGIQGSSLVAIQCTLDSKLVRVDSGDVVFADAVSIPGHGLNARAALDALMRSRVPNLLHAAAARVKDVLENNRDWSIDLVVSELADRDLARDLVPALRRLPGVTAARMVFFRAGLVKYLVAGRGDRDLLAFSTALEGDARLALSLVYETPRVLHARFDLARALPRPVMVLGLVSDVQRAEARELPIMRAGLGLVPYLEAAHTSPLLAEVARPAPALRQLRQRATELGVPLILQLSLSKDDQRWSANAALIEAGTGHALLMGAASNADPEPALSEAIRTLDARYKGALGSPGSRQSLGIARHVSVAPNQGIVVDAFRLVRRGDQEVASVTLRNVGPDQASQLTAKIRSQRQLLAQLDLGVVSVGATAEREILLPSPRPRLAGPLIVEVDYELGGERRRAQSQLLGPVSGDSSEVALDEGVAPAYRELIKTAVRHYNRGDWLEARRLFLSVYEVTPNARVARGLGLVEFDLRNFDASRRYLEEALLSKVRPLEAEQRAQLSQVLQKIAEHEASTAPLQAQSSEH